MTDRYEYLAHLIAGYLREELTAEERAALDAWLAERSENRKFLDELEDTQLLRQKLHIFHAVNRDRLWSLTEAKLADDGLARSQHPIRSLGRRLPYAAALLVGMVVAAWLFIYERPNSNKPGAEYVQVGDIPPGGNRAMLTLADGRTITLDEARDGIVIGGDEITYNDGNPLVNVGEKNGTALLAMSTPKGGTYQVKLPDGTQVWLNAASTLRYPPRFSGSERIVELVGEAYFSVAKDAQKPFKVISAGQEVRVLGTEFNISAYPDDSEARTTLVEGKVRLSHLAANKSINLLPGEQGVLQKGELKKFNTDIAAVIAWKFGRFNFDNKPFAQIINEMARWYDIDVEYEGPVPTNNFIGDAYRTENLRTVLRFLKNSGIQHRMERHPNGRYRLIIRNGKEAKP